jgi:hypothetical protein
MTYPTHPNGVNRIIYIDPFEWWTQKEAEEAQETDSMDTLDDLEEVACDRALISFQQQENNVVTRVLCKPDYM